MKKLLIAILVATTFVTLTGCKDKNDTGSNNGNVSTNEKVEKEEESGRSNAEMYKVYEELLPKVKSYYESLGVELETNKSKKSKDYDGDTGITFRNYDNKTLGEFSVLDYGISYTADGKVNFLSGSMYMNIDEEFYKGGNFKFEETPFYELSKIFGAGNLDYSGINEKVNAYFNGNGSAVVERIDGEFAERINLSDSEFVYIINITP